MTAFFTPADIGNRAAQHAGANRMDPIKGFNDGTRVAAEISFVYDKVRQAELERNTWTCAIKRTVLRAIDQNTMMLAPALWAPLTTYFVGSIVNDQSGNHWISKIPNNLGNDPLLTNFWEPYFGARAVPLFNPGTAYFAGELVYTFLGDGTYRVYLSLENANSDTPGTPTPYDPTVTYFKNQIVTFDGVPYMSLVDLNRSNEPDITNWTTTFIGGTGSIKWLEVGGAEFPAGVSLNKLNLIYPLGSGPSTQTATRNCYKLPAGFLRVAPQNPKQGTEVGLGFGSGNGYDDWIYEGGYLVTSDMGPIPLRFVADLTDVRLMHAMLCEGLACRIGVEVAPILTQSNANTQTIASAYQKFMSEARTLNAIEDGYEDPPVDDLITCRY